MSTDDAVIEAKDVQRTHTLNGRYLDVLYRRATKQGKAAVYVIQFKDAKITATITITRS
jgi:hypothetical protein